MNIHQFFVVISLLFFCPYIPAIVLGWKTGMFVGKPIEIGFRKMLELWVAEIFTLIFLLASTVYLGEIATFSNVLNPNIFEQAGIFEQIIWTVLGYSLPIMGFA